MMMAIRDHRGYPLAMPQQVFISHAGADAIPANEVARRLEGVSIHPVLDRDTNRPGSDFIDFMERALADCDYCLLLWSQAAASRPCVQLEWEAALHRTIRDARRFLVAARLEDHPLPQLLAPRLSFDLFPGFSPGIDGFIGMCTADRAASEASGRPVLQPTTAVARDEQGDTIYITSEEFQLTQPVQIVLSTPAGVLLDRLIQQLDLPRQQDVRGVLGVKYEWRLVSKDRRVVRNESLASQDVRPLAILQLEVEPALFARSTPVAGITNPAFRDGLDERNAALDEARRLLKIAVQRAGLGY